MKNIAIVKGTTGYYTKYTNGNKYITTSLYNPQMEFIGITSKHPNHTFSLEVQVAIDIDLNGGTLVYLA